MRHDVSTSFSKLDQKNHTMAVFTLSVFSSYFTDRSIIQSSDEPPNWDKITFRFDPIVSDWVGDIHQRID